MKKYLIFLIAPIIILMALFTVAGCSGVEEDNPPPAETERVTYSEQTNPYAEYEWNAFPDIADWDSRLTEEPVYYEFEGAYRDVFMMFPTMYIYLNCYEDGALHAIFYNSPRSDYYGYWTNVDAEGNPKLVLHVLNCDGKQYNNGKYELECEQIESSIYDGYYEYYYYGIIFETYFGNQMVGIEGFHYSPIASLSVSGEKKDFIIGEDFSYRELTVEFTRANGKCRKYESYDIGPRFTFEGFDSSKNGIYEVYVKYFGTDACASYICLVNRIKEITVSGYVGDGLYPGEDFEAYCSHINVCAIKENGQKVSISNSMSTCSFEVINEYEDYGEMKITYKPTGHSITYKYTIYSYDSDEADLTV